MSASHSEALVVGVNYYPKFDKYTPLHALTTAANDAENIGSELEKNGFESFRVQRLPRKSKPNQEYGYVVNPDGIVKADELKTAIKNLFNPPPSEAPELAILFFSGHAWRQTIKGKEEVFLATGDILPEHQNYGVPLSWLGEQLENSPAKKLIVWLDCCFSGELFKYLEKDYQDKDYCFITATRSFEQAVGTRYELGLFTQILKDGLNPSDKADGIVESQKLTRHIVQKMKPYLQVPQFKVSDRTILLTSKFPIKKFQNICPYRSLDFFTEKPEDACFFYGRANLTKNLIKQVIKKKHRLIAVFGQSGCGKSSLLRAGLLYQLKLGQIIPGSNNWIYFRPFNPSANPLERLSEVIGNNFEVNIENLPQFLIVDQFEECFTMCDVKNRRDFILRLTELLANYSNLKIIIGMRSDYRFKLREYSEFTKQMSKINVEHLNRDEIKEAITKPAELVGLGIQSGLTRELIKEVEEYTGSLPLLQDTLTELWKKGKNEKFLRLETYQNLGGIEVALEKRANQVIKNLPKEKKDVVKRIFLELTQIGDTFDVRRRVCLGELQNSHHSLELLDEVTYFLADKDNRLITRSDASFLNDGTKNNKASIIVEVVHEALIRNWGMLQNWRAKYREAMVIERKIENYAREWKQNKYKSTDLLKGAKLIQAQEYEKKYGHLGMLDGIAEQLIIKSKNFRFVTQFTTFSLISITLIIASIIYYLNSCPLGRDRLFRSGKCFNFTFTSGDNDDELLISKNNIFLQTGIKKFKSGDLKEAIKDFQDAMTVAQYDPIPLIFYNNARARLYKNNKGQETLKIAVVYPIDEFEKVSKNMLRGVADAQNDFNDKIRKNIIEIEKKNYRNEKFNHEFIVQKYINTRLLEIVIVNGSSDKKITKKVAEKVALRDDILGIIGHRSSGSSLIAKEIYAKKKIPMISPSSSGTNLENMKEKYPKKVFFRTVRSNNIIAKITANHAKKLALKEILIIYEDDSPYSKNLMEELKKEFPKDSSIKVTSKDFKVISKKKEIDQGTSIIEADDINSCPDIRNNIKDNFSSINLNDVKQLGIQEAGIFLLPSTDSSSISIFTAYCIAEELKNVQLFGSGSSTIDKDETLIVDKEDLEGFILALPITSCEYDLENNSNGKGKKWSRSNISWRTSSSYNATKIFTDAIDQSSNPISKLTIGTNIQDLIDKDKSELDKDKSEAQVSYILRYGLFKITNNSDSGIELINKHENDCNHH